VANENSGKPWSPADEKELAKLAAGNTSTRVIAMKLGRTEQSIRSKAKMTGVSLGPSNQSPYNRTKK